MGNEYIDLPFNFETKGLEETTGIFYGYGSMFGGNPDSYGDIIVKGAFKDSLELGGRNGYGVSMLWQHDPTQPIGTWLELNENEKGLNVVGKLTKGVRQADEALLLMKDGALQGLSIGYEINRNDYEYDEKKKIRYLKKINLWEISPVTFPANTRARVTTVKAIENAKTERELEKALRDAGLSHKEAVIMVSRCKPYLREIKKQTTWLDVLSIVKSYTLWDDLLHLFVEKNKEFDNNFEI